ncbi:MAG TPA: tRNA 2-thiouridine(34) synthase MnmA [Candidatus Sulfotelmatobacter sp.]|nr:tRNA 2-thiouridine(34) synthase MnmA [Candidatus Sulfotelmatobacter sp.]
MPNSDTIAVAMSGGVDSSTVAAMLRAGGLNVIGLTMQLWNQRRLAGHEGMPESVQGRCCSLDDVYDARRVAEHIGIPYYVVNHEERFEREVVRPFVAEYLSGRTPIPCSLCNNHLKFDQLLVVARQIGAERVATGHYARVAYDGARGRWLLRRPADKSKDLTYFLFGLTQDQLSRTLFPLGDMTKPEVRDLARKHGLALAEKPDSQEICFVPGGDYKRFIDAYLADQGESLPDAAGELVTTNGEVIGEHHGIHNFTVGQRKGLGVATGSPLYVIQISGANKQVIVGGEDNLYSRTLRARRANLISVDDLREPMRVTVKIRHRHEPAPAVIEKITREMIPSEIIDAEASPSANPDAEILVTFDQPQRAITPGQAAVFYDGDTVVGGGWIV